MHNQQSEVSLVHIQPRCISRQQAEIETENQ